MLLDFLKKKRLIKGTLSEDGTPLACPHTQFWLNKSNNLNTECNCRNQKQHKNLFKRISRILWPYFKIKGYN